MKIEIAPPSNFSQSGQSLLRLIQNNDMPVLDLLVRESVQNSLDAWDRTNDYVLVEYNIGKFSSYRLSKELDGITGALNKRYGNRECSFISISDSNTSGLTGKIDKPHSNGNLQKLIYQICQAQSGEGAGGSWGIGKTVYFRVGIGMVIYYSRVKLENGSYQSRMAASLVEDETSPDAMIPAYGSEEKRGVAWWGKLLKENTTIPTTDEKEITRILSVFNLKPYTGSKVGTCIIIPYIDMEYLLHHNVLEYNDSLNHPVSIPWQSSVEKYIRISVQKWYMPRLNNIYYQRNRKAAYLKVSINGKPVGSVLPDDDDCEPIFQIVKGLYNRAAFGNSNYGDIISKSELRQEPIETRGILQQTAAGTVAYIKVDRKLLKMEAPYNKYDPMIYLNQEILSPEKNRPIVCFTRKAGMIVSYETVGGWTDGIPNTDSDHYIVGVFVLNSENRLKNEYSGMSLDEYVRKSELADHTSWTDISLNNKNPRIISRIKNHVSSKIAKAYAESEAEEQSSINSGYSKFFGDMLLPPESFGKRPTGNTGGGGGGSREIIRHKDVSVSMAKDAIQYRNGEVIITFSIKTRRAISYLEVENLILASDTGGSYSADEWTDTIGSVWPFDLEAADLSMQKWGNTKANCFLHLNEKTRTGSFEKFECQFKYTSKGDCCGIILSAPKEYSFSFNCTFRLQIYRMEFKTLIGVNTKRSDG